MMQQPQLLTRRNGAPAASLWSLDPSYHHLNHGSFGGVPTEVQAQQRELMALMEANPVRWFVQQPARVAAARESLAPLLGVTSDDLVFVPNATAGCSVVYRHLEERNAPVTVAITNHTYGAVRMGAERLAQRTGGRVVTIDVPVSTPADDVVDIIDTALAANPVDLLVIDQITSATARAFPTTQISAVAHQRGALVLVDGAHAPGVLEQPVDTECDVWVGNLHKFWCAPRGTAVLVRHNPDLNLFPLIDSWGTPDPYPTRFDMQGTLDHTAWLCAAATHEHLETELGWSQIRRYSRELMDWASQVLAQALSDRGVVEPVPDVGQPVGPLRLFRLPGQRRWTHAEADALRVPFMDASQNILSFTTIGDQGFMRLSTHAYTTPEDISELANTGIGILDTLITDLPN